MRYKAISTETKSKQDQDFKKMIKKIKQLNDSVNDLIQEIKERDTVTIGTGPAGIPAEDVTSIRRRI